MTLDVAGVGIGPFNLGLAALLEGAPEVDARFFEQRPAFRWHPGLLIDGTTVQVPFLADLVTLADPTNRWSFLNYLRARDRLYAFYFREQFHVLRREYDDYCRWVAEGLGATCRFGARVTDLGWDGASFALKVTDEATGAVEEVRARDLVLGVGTRPSVPPAFDGLLDDRVFHSAEFLDHRDGLRGARRVCVVGSGQSGAEVVLELLRTQPDTALDWVTRSPGFLPMEYSKLGLERFSPDYVRYFHGLPEATRDALLPAQHQLYKAIDADTIAAIHDALYERGLHGGAAVQLRPATAVESCSRHEWRIRLVCHQLEQDEVFAFDPDAVVLATGYTSRFEEALGALAPLVRRDGSGRPQVDLGYRVAMDPAVTGRLFVQNAELHSHGIGTPDLGLGAHRSATIVNALAGREVYRLPQRTVFTSFGLGAQP